MNDMVIIKDDITVTSSRTVAKHFDKAHDKVMRDIADLIADIVAIDSEETAPNQDTAKIGDIQKLFIKDKYVDDGGRNRKMYWLTEDGFNLLVMGYEGEKALEFKLAFLAEFNRMRDVLRDRNAAIAQDKAVDFIELCNVEYEAAKPDQRKFTNAVKVLIEYAVSNGVDRHSIDPAYYKFTNAHINRALGIDNGLRPFANPTTTVHCRNLHKIIKRLIRSGIENNHHHALILEDVLDAIDDYGTEHIDAEERARNNTFAKAHKQHDKERRAIERANKKLALEAAKPDPDYDIDDDDEDDEDKDFITEV